MSGFEGPLQLVLYALMLGCGLGVVFGVGSRVLTRRGGEFPFGPALAAACLVVVLPHSPTAPAPPPRYAYHLVEQVPVPRGALMVVSDARDVAAPGAERAGWLTEGRSAAGQV